MVKPPPIPSRPARKPTSAPSARKIGSSAKFKPLGQLDGRLPFLRRHRRNGQPVAAAKRDHAGERRFRPHFRQRHESSLLHELHVDVEPARILAGRLRVVVRDSSDRTASRPDARASTPRRCPRCRAPGSSSDRRARGRRASFRACSCGLVVAHAKPRRRLPAGADQSSIEDSSGSDFMSQ